MRDIHISPATNGYIVIVGCRTVVFETQNTLIRELEKYLSDPLKVEKKYLEDEKYKERYPVPAPATNDQRQGTEPGRTQVT